MNTMASKIDKASSEPLYHQIMGILERKIIAGDLKPGERVPSEQELADTYAVSRLTARKSLDLLVAKNFLFRRPGKGTFVADSGMSYGFSAMLSFSKSLAARGFKVETRILEQGIIPGPEDIADRLRLAAGARLVIVRRLRFVDGIPAAIHTSYFDAGLYASILEGDLSRESILDAADRASGSRAAWSQDSLRAVPLCGVDAQLLGVAHGSPSLELDGVVFDEHNAPSRFTRAIYRGDLFRLEIRNTASQTTLLRVATAPATP
jgi:GntR family transcriptional regulator